jgi:hypothetical protein
LRKTPLPFRLSGFVQLQAAVSSQQQAIAKRYANASTPSLLNLPRRFITLIPDAQEYLQWNQYKDRSS